MAFPKLNIDADVVYSEYLHIDCRFSIAVSFIFEQFFNIRL